MDLGVALAGLVTGVLVGLTGMGGGALTMPILVLVFGVPPLAAVSTDLVANAVMKPFGAVVHLRRKTVNARLVGWLCLGSLPCAALGPVVDQALGSGKRLHAVLGSIAGVAVLLAAITLFARMYLDRSRPVSVHGKGVIRVRPVPTVLVGALGGLIVGMTSVGSGSIIIVCLLLLQRGLTSAQLVGTDLVQAVPLVLVAGLGHLWLGEVDMALAGSLLVGSIPGVLVGAMASSRVPDRPVRIALGAVLVGTGMLLVGSGIWFAAIVAALIGTVAAVSLRAGFTRRDSARTRHTDEETRTGMAATIDDHQLAERLATRAGGHLLTLRDRDGLAGSDALREEGDRSSHELLIAELGRYRPDDPVLSEHGVAGPGRTVGGRVWIVDPLDGTREFGERDRQDWAVHVALVEDGIPVGGAVALPAQGTVLSTANPPARPVRAGPRLRIAVSRSRPPAFVAELAEALDAEAVPIGSAGAKIAAVIAGDVDAYVHAGGQYEWDSAAPVAVAQAVGLHTSRLDGRPLTYDHADAWLPDLVVCRSELAEQVLDALAQREQS